MSKSKSMEIIEKAYNDHARDLVKWALRRFKSPEDAEDLCQEVMSRFAKMVITKEAEGEQIVKPDSYLWRIAYTLLDAYGKDAKKNDKLLQTLEGDSDIEMQINVGDGHDRPDSTNHDTMLKKLRLSISQLDYKLREAMIMYHLEKKSVAEIAKKLEVTESYVRKILFESHNIIRKKIKNNLYDIDKVYRPNRVRMGISGKRQDSYNHKQIDESLSKQNICMACYDKPCSIEELSQQLGLPSAYLEWDIAWLVENNFLKKQRNKYSTMFFIYDGTFDTRLTNIFFKHKKLFDKIVDMLTALFAKMRAIGFIGSERPINQLLWLMIYTFTDIASRLAYEEEVGSKFTYKNSTTGENYYSWGVYSIESTIALHPQFMERYMELRKWEIIGSSSYNEGDDMIYWLLVRKHSEYLPTFLTEMGPIPRFYHNRHLLYRVFKPDFDISNLTDSERYSLSYLADLGVLSIAEDGVTVIPHVYVFTAAQRKEFERLLTECYPEVQAEMREMYTECRKMCKECLPKQLDGLLDLVSFISLIGCHVGALGFAYYDGKLFIPQDTDDLTLQTVSVTVGN